MSDIIISIALCTYNGEAFLKEQLDSFAQQSRLPDELVICDDGSNDATGQLIKDFTKNAPFRVRLFFNDKNLGYRKNFEQALSLCKGDIIALSDQDDVWLKNRLTRFEEIFLRDPAVGFAFCDASMVDEKLNDLGATRFDQFRNDQFRNDPLFRDIKNQPIGYKPIEFTKILLKNNSVVPGCLIVVRRGLIKNALPLPELWAHDDWISLAGSLLGKVMVIPDILMKYRLHSSNTCPLIFESRKTSRRSYFRIAERYSQALKRILEDDHYATYRSELREIIGGKINHSLARSAMSNKFIDRMQLIIKEIVSLRYFKHSSGIKSIGRDLFLID